MIKFKKYSVFFIYLLGIIFGKSTFSQELQNTNNKNLSIQSLMGLSTESELKLSQVSSSNTLSASINEDEYIVDAGDVFVIKIDVRGPALKMYNSVVSPEGYLVIPDAPSIYVKYSKLKDAKIIIKKSLKKEFPNAVIETFLYYIHPIKVTVVGAIPKPVKISLFSNNRLFDAINSAFAISQADTTILFNWNSISYRNIELINKFNDERKIYDLLKFKLIADKNENPYLMDEDIIYIQYKDSIKHHLEINGAVARPLLFEYKPKDNLELALDMAGGILPNADSGRIELIRFEKSSNKIDKIELQYPQDINFNLLPDDRIYVREKFKYHEKNSIVLEGAVKYPGKYSIFEGQTKLTEIIDEAGGFTERASLENAKILRNKNITEDKELGRLSMMQVSEMNKIEKSYFRSRSREDSRLVSCNFNKLFNEKDLIEDVILQNEDLIIIPEKLKTIFISGGVNSPGYVNIDPNYNYLDYVKLAGGFNDLAREGKVKIIKKNSGVWIDADEDMILEEGDIIFIPESEDLYWYDMFREGLSVVTQIATIVLIVINLQKL